MKNNAVEHLSIKSWRTRTGLRLACPENIVPSLDMLFERRFVSRSLLQQHGFIVIDGFYGDHAASGSHTIPESKIIDGRLQEAGGTQLLHKDGRGDQDFLMLTYAGRTGGRSADTAIAHDSEAVFELFLEFFQRHVAAFQQRARIPAVVEELAFTLQSRGVDGLALLPAFSSINQAPWRSFLFRGFGSAVLADPLLEQFYREAVKQDLVYLHRWQKDQAVLIDNQAMLHARVIREEPPEHPDGTPVLRRLFRWDGENPVPLTQAK